MTGGVLDWLGRAVMLALAGLVTLSIIGSIAAIPSGSIESRIGLETQPPPPGPPPLAEPESGRAEPQVQPAQTSGAQAERGPSGPAPAPAADASRWLEAITYALLALVGLAALASLILWRGVRERRRIADALETLARRP